MGLTFVVSKLPTSPKGSAFELFYVTVFIAFQKFIDISFQGIFIGAGGKLFFISLRKEIRIPTHFILLYSPAFFVCYMPVWSIWQLFLSALKTDLAKQHLVASFVTSDSVSGKVRSRSSEEPLDRQAQVLALVFIFLSRIIAAH